MKINRIVIYKEKNKKAMVVKTAQLVENKGIEGDRFARGGEKQVSIMDKKLLDTMDKQSEKFSGCTNRIKANIVTEGCRVAGLRVGDRMFIGETELEITEDMRSCSEECQILKDGISCPIRYGTLFAKIIKGGEIHDTDSLSVKMKITG